MNRTKLRRRTAMQPKNKPQTRTQAIKSERRLELNPNKRKPRLRKPRLAISKLNQQNTLDVVKCVSGPASVKVPEEKLSDESIIYVGTTYLNFLDVPKKVSVIDLTRSENNYDNAELKVHPVSSSCSICTIFPPKPSYLFDSPSDEMCACSRRLSQKRNLSLTDVTYVKPKRRMQSASRNVREEIDGEST